MLFVASFCIYIFIRNVSLREQFEGRNDNNGCADIDTEQKDKIDKHRESNSNTNINKTVQGEENTQENDCYEYADLNQDTAVGLPAPVVEGYLLPVLHKGGYLHATHQAAKGTGDYNIDGCAYEDTTEMSIVTKDL